MVFYVLLINSLIVAATVVVHYEFLYRITLLIPKMEIKHGSIMDSVYFSFTVFSTVGFGDIEPTGNLRFLTGIESLTGLVLITWSASFLYFEMQRHWKQT